MPARSSTYAEDWRSRPSRPSGTSLRLARLVATGLAVFLTVCLIYLLIWLFPSRATIRIACLPIQEYHRLAAPPITYARLDARGLEQLYATAGDGDPYFCQPPEQCSANQIHAGFLPRFRDWRTDVLICAVWARPRWESSRLVLVCNDWEPHHCFSAEGSSRDGPVLPLSDLLEALAENPAAHKILILDAGRGSVGPNGGTPTFDLEELVRDELARARPGSGRIWVWLASSSWEQSHVMPDQQRSVFHHFLGEALQGQADGVTGEGDDGVKDRRIDLAEAYEYVRRNVSAWVWSQSRGGRTQTPRLLSTEQGDLVADARRVMLRYLPRAAVSGDQDADAKTQAGSDAADPGSEPTGSENHDRPNTENPELMAADQQSLGTEPTDRDQPPEAATPASAAPEAGPTAIDDFEAFLQFWGAELAALDDVHPTLQAVLRQYAEASYRPLTDCAELKEDLLGWRPVDYAPHLMRRFEELMVSYRRRAVSLPRAVIETSISETADVSTSNEIRNIRNEVELLIEDHHREVCSLAKGFRGSQTQNRWDKSEVVKRLVQTRNQALFELPYYIRLQTQLPAVVDERAFYDGVRHLIQSLELLTRALESGIVKRTPPGAGAARWMVAVEPGSRETDLEVLVGDVQSHRAWLQRQLGLSSPEDLNSLDPLYQFDLLATPLVDPAEQVRLAHRVLLPSSGTDSRPAGPVLSEVQWNSVRQRSQRQSWFRARLELEALLLTADTNADQRAVWQERLVAWPEDMGAESETLTQRLLDLEDLICQRGRMLGDETEDGAEPTFRTEMALRLVPAWFVDAAENARTAKVPVGVAVGWSEEVPGRFLPPAGSDPGPLPLHPQPQTLVWTLKLPAGTIREGLRLEVEYPVDLLQVTDPEGRRIRGREFWPVEHDAEQTDITLRIQVRALKQDGSPARLTITLPDEGLRASAALQLPEPTLLNLTIAGPEGTLEGDLQTAVGGTSRQERPRREVQFNESGYAKVTLRPYPSAPTWYEITASNPSSRDWQVQASVWAIPDELRMKGGRDFDPWDPSSQGPIPGCIPLAHNEWIIPAGQSVPVSLFPQAADPVPSEPSDVQGPASPPAPAPEPVEVGGGLLCLLEHSGIQQRLWLDVHPLHPEFYLEPRVSYDPARRLVRIEIRAPIPQRLPTKTSRIDWEIRLKDQENVRVQYQSRELELGTGRALAGEAEVEADEAIVDSVPVIISADGYPRAFEYVCPLSGAASNRNVTRWYAEVLLCEVDENGQFKRDERGELILVPPNAAFTELEQIGVVFRADTPPSVGDSDYLLRVFLRGKKATEGGAALGESKEFFRDRDVRVKMEQPESGHGFVLHSRIEELTAVLRTGNYRNQEIIVSGEVESIPRQGKPATLQRADQRSVWHDSVPPRIVEVRPTEVTVGDLIVVEAEDELTGVAEVWYAPQRDPVGKLLEPKNAERHQSTPDSKVIFRIPSDAFEPEQDHDLYLAATDGAGNTSVPILRKIRVKAVPPETVQEPSKMPLDRKTIEGEVSYGGRSIGDATVVLKGPKEDRTKTDIRGKFGFRDLPAGKYELEASGYFQGSLRRGKDTIDLTGLEPSVSVRLPLK